MIEENSTFEKILEEQINIIDFFNKLCKIPNKKLFEKKFILNQNSQNKLTKLLELEKNIIKEILDFENESDKNLFQSLKNNLNEDNFLEILKKTFNKIENKINLINKLKNLNKIKQENKNNNQNYDENQILHNLENILNQKNLNSSQIINEFLNFYFSIKISKQNQNKISYFLNKLNFKNFKKKILLSSFFILLSLNTAFAGQIKEIFGFKIFIDDDGSTYVLLEEGYVSTLKYPEFHQKIQNYLDNQKNKNENQILKSKNKNQKQFNTINIPKYNYWMNEVDKIVQKKEFFESSDEFYKACYIIYQEAKIDQKLNNDDDKQKFTAYFLIAKSCVNRHLSQKISKKNLFSSNYQTDNIYDILTAKTKSQVYNYSILNKKNIQDELEKINYMNHYGIPEIVKLALIYAIYDKSNKYPIFYYQNPQNSNVKWHNRGDIKYLGTYGSHDFYDFSKKSYKKYKFSYKKIIKYLKKIFP